MPLDKEQLREAILIRQVEEEFLSLYSKGKLNGTVHTCVGQEFSAIAFAGQLNSDDFVFSNHRCHGHFISFTKDYRGLIAELMGRRTGVCGGVGGSQHLYKNNFYSNGIQGGILAVSAGLALAHKIKKTNSIGVVYIGDGTLGEGLTYETMNIISKWDIPLLIVCENNQYAQSTNNKHTIAGDIIKRPDAFGIKTFQNNTERPEDLIQGACNSIAYVRSEGKPAFHLVDTYRLNSHSKSDDNRDEAEIAEYRKKDPLVLFEQNKPDEYAELLNEVDGLIKEAVEDIDKDGSLNLKDYVESDDELPPQSWRSIDENGKRQVDLLYEAFNKYLSDDSRVLFLGEDIMGPYGGAFKITKDLSDKYPGQFYPTPISEAAIAGISNGLALGGMRPFAELMFGDFILLAMDQIINHASKFYHMYNKQVTCPVVLRTPMGGRRGYGPTHSQTLDKFLLGIDNVTVAALNAVIDPALIYDSVMKQNHPVIVVENKIDYGKKVGPPTIPNYKSEINNREFPTCRIRPVSSEPTLTIVTYGGASLVAIEAIEELLFEHDYKTEVIILSSISPIDYDAIVESVQSSKSLFVLEEGSAEGGIGSEIIASMSERIEERFVSGRIASLPVPIPSVKELEDEVLSNKVSVIEQIHQSMILTTV